MHSTSAGNTDTLVSRRTNRLCYANKNLDMLTKRNDANVGGVDNDEYHMPSAAASTDNEW